MMQHRKQTQSRSMTPLSPLLALVSLVLLSWVFATPALALSFDEVQDRGEIIVAVYKDFKPFSYEDQGQWRGIDVEIAQAIAKDLGVKLRLMPLTADESVDDDLRNGVWKGHYLERQKADVMLHVPYDKELEQRNEQVVLFGPYFKEEIVLARSVAKLGKDATLAVFRYEKIGVEIDSLADMYLAGAFGGSIRNNLLHYRSTAAAAEALKQGETAGIMGQRSLVESALADQPAEAYDIGKVPTPGLVKDQWLIGAAIQNTYRQLGYAINDTLGRLVTSGELEALFKRHGLSYQTPPLSFYR